MKTSSIIHSRSFQIALALLVPLVLGLGLFRVNLNRRRAYVPLLSIAVAPPDPRMTQSVVAITYSPDGKSLAGVDDWSNCYVFDADTGQVARKWKWRYLRADSLTWSRDGKTLAGSSFGAIEVCSAMTGAWLRRFQTDPDRNLREMSNSRHIDYFVSPDANLGAALQWQDSITVWNLRTGKQTFRLKAFKRPDGLRTEACGLAFSSDASQMAVARVLLNEQGSKSDPGPWMACGFEIALYDLRAKRVLRVFQRKPYYLNRRVAVRLLYSPDAKTLAFNEGAFVRIWDVKGDAAGQRVTLSSAGGTGGQQHLAFSPDSKLIARAGLNGEVEVWSVRSGQLLHTFHVRDSVSDVKFSPDGKRLATSGGTNRQGGFIKLWDTSFLKS